MATKKKLIPVVVYTEKRGVFFGYADPSALKAPSWRHELRLERARMAVHWDASTRGMPGLSAQGPGKGCRISPAMPAITLVDLSGWSELSDEAVAAWEAAPWA